MTKEGVIGNGDKLPWSRLEGDLPRFKQLTLEHPIIMGKNTWFSLPKQPLPGRLNVVVSPSLYESSRELAGAVLVPTLEDALAHVQTLNTESFIIGGKRMFEESLPLASRVYLTETKENYKGNVIVSGFSFPPSDWRMMSKEVKQDHAFSIYDRRIG